jgi:CHASE3 domain sensor protein
MAAANDELESHLGQERPDNQSPQGSSEGEPQGYSTVILRPWATRLRLLVFVVGALLLLGMAILSLGIIHRMSQRVQELTGLQENMDRARRMEFLITAQSHFRAMALLTTDESWNVKIAQAKEDFLDQQDIFEGAGRPERLKLLSQVREANDRLTGSSARVLGLYETGQIEEALDLHIAQEHEVSHEVEARIRSVQRDVVSQMDTTRALYGSDVRLITRIVWAFSGVGLAAALLLGLATALAFIRPVRAIDRALTRWHSEQQPQSLERATGYSSTSPRALYLMMLTGLWTVLGKPLRLAVTFLAISVAGTAGAALGTVLFAYILDVSGVTEGQLKNVLEFTQNLNEMLKSQSAQ